MKFNDNSSKNYLTVVDWKLTLWFVLFLEWGWGSKNKRCSYIHMYMVYKDLFHVFQIGIPMQLNYELIQSSVPLPAGGPPWRSRCCYRTWPGGRTAGTWSPPPPWWHPSPPLYGPPPRPLSSGFPGDWWCCHHPVSSLWRHWGPGAGTSPSVEVSTGIHLVQQECITMSMYIYENNLILCHLHVKFVYM